MDLMLALSLPPAETLLGIGAALLLGAAGLAVAILRSGRAIDGGPDSGSALWSEGDSGGED